MYLGIKQFQPSVLISHSRETTNITPFLLSIVYTYVHMYVCVCMHVHMFDDSPTMKLSINAFDDYMLMGTCLSMGDRNGSQRIAEQG